MARRRRSRKKEDTWEKMRKDMVSHLSKPKGVEGREHVPEVACGKCKNFSENAWASDGRGFCGVLKVGSDLTAEPPVFVTEGDAGLMTMFNMDAAKCTYFEKMKLIDTEGSECVDPQYRRAQRQMEKHVK